MALQDIQFQTKVHSPGFYAYLATQFLGAFNDNVFKIMIICFAIRHLPEQQANFYIPLAGGLFILPFLLFSSYAGCLADRFSKKQVMIWTKVAEIFIMLLGVIFFHYHAVWTLLFILFCMGAQSTFFSPAKYGFLPEVLSEEDLSRGNGMTQLFTFLAIVLGGWAGGLIMGRFGSRPGQGALFCLVIAVLGCLVSLKIQPTPPGSVRTPFLLDPFTPHWRTFQQMRKDKLLLLSLLGGSFFWLVGVFFQLELPLLFTRTLRQSDQMVGHAQAVLAVGIGIGCSLAGSLSRRRIEYGLILPGIFFTACSSILIGCTVFHWLPAMILFACGGFFSGFFQLPLEASIQKRSPKKALGRYLGAANAMDCIAMILGTLFQALCLNLFALSPAGSFILMGLVILGVTILMLWKVPSLLYRMKRMLFS